MRSCCGVHYKQKEKNAAHNIGGVDISKDYCKESLKDDRKNSRGPQGKSMPQRTITNRPAKVTCKIFLVIGKDDIGFFFVAGRGCVEHSGHIKINPEQKALQTRLLNKEDMQLLKNVSKANALNATGRNIMFAKTGQYLSSAQVRYRAQMGKVLALLPQNGLPYDVIQKSTECGPDRLFAYFEQEKISFSCLYHTVSTTFPAKSTDKSAGSLQHEAVEVESNQDAAQANTKPYTLPLLSFLQMLMKT
jgi:hypothetical protein